MKLFFLSILTFFLVNCISYEQKDITLIDPPEMLKLLERDDVQLIDVRTPEEFNTEHIKNAKNIDVLDNAFIEKIQDLDKTKPLAIYCRSGKRSAKASKLFKENDFKDIYDLKGGILNWKEQGFKTQNK